MDHVAEIIQKKKCAYPIVHSKVKRRLVEGSSGPRQKRDYASSKMINIYLDKKHRGISNEDIADTAPFERKVKPDPRPGRPTLPNKDMATLSYDDRLVAYQALYQRDQLQTALQEQMG